MQQESFVVLSTRPDCDSRTYLGQEGFVRSTTLDAARQYLAEKREGKKDPQSTKLYRLVEVE